MKKTIFACLTYILILVLLCTIFGCCSKEDHSLGFKNIIENQDEYINKEEWMTPNLSGWSCVEVANILDNIGQVYEIILVNNEDANVNVIIEQYPAEGEILKKDEVLQLKVNKYYTKSNSITVLYSFINPIAEIGKWVYFTDGMSLFKSCNDFKSCEKIYSLSNINGSIVSIMPKENEIFFIIDYGRFEYSLCSVETGATNHKEIYKSAGLMGCLTLGDTIYLFDGDMNIISYNLMKNEINIIDPEFRSYSFLQLSGYRYYIETGQAKNSLELCSQSIDDNSVTVLVDLEKNLATDVCIFNDDLYYICYSKSDDDKLFNFNELLYKYDLHLKEKILIAEIGTNQGAADQNQLFVWRGSMIVANEDRIIKINSKDNSFEDLRIVRPEGDINSHSILCGNYIYQYIPYREINKLCNGRYNLLTEEYEEFNWDDVKSR